MSILEQNPSSAMKSSGAGTRKGVDHSSNRFLAVLSVASAMAALVASVLLWDRAKDAAKLADEVKKLSDRLALLEQGLDTVRGDQQRVSAAISERNARLSPHEPFREETILAPPVSAPTPVTTPLAAAASDARRKRQEEALEYRVRARISAIERFVPLSQDQKDRLRSKFLRELGEENDDDALPTGEGPPQVPPTEEHAEPETEPETLEAIIGDESATYYRERMKQAFDQATAEEQEKDVLLLSRKLALTDAQETQIRSAMKEVEEQVQAEMKAQQQVGGTGARGKKVPMQARMQALLAENATRKRILDERMRSILTAEQFALYAQEQANSATADFETFHSPE